jgi:hypothetical protein
VGLDTLDVCSHIILYKRGLSSKSYTDCFTKSYVYSLEPPRGNPTRDAKGGRGGGGGAHYNLF